MHFIVDDWNTTVYLISYSRSHSERSNSTQYIARKSFEMISIYFVKEQTADNNANIHQQLERTVINNDVGFM